jgi:peptidoglycan/xylan/chitin deacetylase (PgdA/CDA1 family)
MPRPAFRSTISSILPAPRAVAAAVALSACTLGLGCGAGGDDHDDETGSSESEVGVAVPRSLDLDKRKIVYLTFDDGPNRALTPRILDVLARHRAKATFFLTGDNIRGNEDIVRREAAEGHIVANHQQKHVVASTSQFAQWVPFERDAIDRVVGTPQPKYFRYPYGDGNAAKEAILKREGYVDGGVGWDLDTLDWCFAGGRCSRAPGYESDFEGWVVAHTQSRGGGVALFHDVQSVTANHLDSILTRLESLGYRFANLPATRGVEARNVTGPRYCVPGTSYDANVGFCVDADNAYGPFPEAMLEKCRATGGGRACDATLARAVDGQGQVTIPVPRWSKANARYLRGTGRCPIGTTLDAGLGYCTEAVTQSGGQITNAYGPFETALVTKCAARGGGASCYLNRWNASFLRTIIEGR